MRIFAICLLALCLSGCQQMQQQQQQEKITAANATFNAKAAACRNGETLSKNNAVAWADCLATANTERGYAVNNPNMWIVDKENAADRESAVEYSEGKISEEQFKTDTQKHFAEAKEEEAGVFAQQRQENMQRLQTIQGMLPQPQPMPQPYAIPTSHPIQTNCTTVGTTINCSSY